VSISPRLLQGRFLAVTAVPVLLTLLSGADDVRDDPISRFQSLSPQQRSEISETLRRFDLQFAPEQQKAIRDLDQQIQKLPVEDRAHYQTVLRRYHNWLDSLPETVKDNLLAKPASERMAQVKTLIVKYPLPPEKTPFWMQLTNIAGGSSFELAAVFKIWQALTLQQRQEIERSPTPAQRREKLFEFGHDLKIPREIRPADFHAEDWIPKVEAKILELRETDPELNAAVTKPAVVKAEAKAEAKARARQMMLRRLAINLYFLEQKPPNPVTAEHLTDFFNALPPWVRTTFDSYPPDEARRRLTIVYRLVFPYPDEFRPARTSAAPTGGSTKKATISGAPSRPTPAPPPPTPVPAKREESTRPVPPAPGSPPY